MRGELWEQGSPPLFDGDCLLPWAESREERDIEKGGGREKGMRRGKKRREKRGKVEGKR
jgi:hypothetical protein